VTTERVGSSLWSPQQRMTTAGLVLLVTMIAFEAMSIGTALPTMVADLDAEALYAWPFTAFLAASVVGTVLAGWLSDTRGPRLPLLVGPALFTVGLVAAALAPTMTVLLLGRVLQGLGAGAAAVALYILVALAYPERDRPAAFGVISAAWVLPAIVGPTVAGLVTEHASWRLVFGGLVPIMLVAGVLLVPLVRRLPNQPAGQASTRRGVLAASAGAAVGLSALTWAAQNPTGPRPVLVAGLAAVGLLVLVPSLRRVLPAGTITARRGLPTVVLSRGLATGAFFAVQAYLPLTLTTVHGLSPTLAGLPLTVGALGWSGASAWQGRHPDHPRHRLLRGGFLLLAVALAGTTLVAFDPVPYWVVLPLWVLAGAGMGLAMPSVSVRLLELSPPQDRGFNSAALQIWDMLMSAACIGLGGALLVAIASPAAPTPAVVVLDLSMVAVALLGAALASRTRTSADGYAG